jgi:hypothetical protein
MGVTTRTLILHTTESPPTIQPHPSINPYAQGPCRTADYSFILFRTCVEVMCICRLGCLWAGAKR